jgi:hypothetical protein
VPGGYSFALSSSPPMRASSPPSLLSVPFFCSTAPQAFFRPDHRSRRPPRAGGLSRPAGTLPVRHPPAFPGRALTAPSTAAPSVGRGGQAGGVSAEKFNPRSSENFQPVVFDRFRAVGDTRSAARLPAGSRIADYVSLGAVAKTFPISTIHAILCAMRRGSIREPDFPAID